MSVRLLLAPAALALSAGTAQADYTLHILHTNDLHSRIEAINKYDSTCSEKDAAAAKCFGGIARVAAKVAALRAELAGQNVIVLDAGDQFQGSLFYTSYKGADTAEFMSKIGYDAMALGNHEFDDGPEGLAAFVGKVQFPLLSGNLDLSRTSLKDKIADTVVLQVGGEKIGLVSALATDTVETSSPGPDIVFQDEIESLKADVQALTDQGVTKIIAIPHTGFVKDQQIAAAVPGIDAVVGGHSHTLFGKDGAAYPTMVGGVPVVSAYAYSKYLGHLVLTFDDAGNLKSVGGEPILLDASVTPDAAVAARVAELAKPLQKIRDKVVAESSTEIDGARDHCRKMECAMGNLVTEAMLDRVKGQGIRIAITNGGGLRASIDAGPVTMGEVLTVLPFQNTLSTFEAKGATILAALENGVSAVEEGEGRFPQVAGLKFSFDPAKPAGARVSAVQVATALGWAPLEPTATYGVVTNNFLRGGGDGYRMFAADGMNAYDFGPDLADVTAEFLAKHSPYAATVDGRIARR